MRKKISASRLVAMPHSSDVRVNPRDAGQQDAAAAEAVGQPS